MARDTRHPNTLLTLIENDKSSQINQTIWRMLRVCRRDQCFLANFPHIGDYFWMEMGAKIAIGFAGTN
jgi:hypothetical protein